MNEYLDLLKATPAAGTTPPDNPYLGLLERVEDERKARLSATLVTTAGANPDEFAKQRQTAAYLGVPTAAVEAQPDIAQQQARIKQVAQDTANSPTLQRKYTDADFAKLAHDDSGVLSSIAAAAKYVFSHPDSRNTMLGDTAGGLYYRSSAALAGVFRAGAELAAPLLDPLAGTVLPENPLRRVAEGFAGIARRAEYDLKQVSPPAEGVVAGGVTSGFQSLGQNSKYLPLALFGPAGAAAALVGMSAESGGQSYQDAREKGLTMAQALPFATSQAIIEYGTEKLPLGTLLEGVNAGAPIWKTLLKTAAAEVPGEQLATVLQDMNEWAVLPENKDKPFSEYLAERPSAAAQTLIATLIGAGGNVVIADTARAAVDRMLDIQRGAQEGEAAGQNLQQLFALAAQSRLRERAPDTFQALVQELADEPGGAPAEVRFDARTLAGEDGAGGVLNQEQLASIPSIQAQLGEALATGGEVVVPIGELMQLADSGVEKALLEHARVGVNELSQAEAKMAADQAEQFLQQEAQRVIETARNVQDMQARADTVLQTVLEQLNTTARFTADVNRAYATLVRDFYVTMADRLGVTPDELYASYPLRVVAKTTTGEALNEPGMRPGAMTVEGYHYSKEARSIISTGAFGTGLEGSARDQYLNAADERLRKRSYFYVDKGTGINPEAGVGGIAHRVQLSNVYDANSDPLRLRRGGQMAFESALLDRGYSGYLDRLEGTQSGQVVMLGDQTFKPEVLGPLAKTTGTVVPPPAERASRGRDQVVDRMRANKSLPGGAMALEKWDRLLAALMPLEHRAMQDAGVFDGGRQETLYKDELVRKFEDLTPAEEYTQKAQLQGKPIPTSIDEVAGVASAFAFASTRAFDTNRDFKQALQDRVLAAAKAAKVKLSEFTRGTEDYLVRVALADARVALQTNANAIGWYNGTTTKALRLAALVHPEISTDPRAKFAFVWALAVTSNGMKVDQNFDLAEKAYSHAKANGGQMPTNIGTGTAAQAINNGLALYNEMLAKHGFEVLERFMTTKQTVKQIEQFTGFKVSGENLSTEVYGAAILGPKIGNGFFANLYGHFEQLTIDRWLMRTWGRWTGTLIEENPGQVKAKREQLRALITSLSPEDKKAFESIIGSRLKLSALDEVAAAIQKASIKPANRVKMAAIGLASDEAGQARLAEILGPLKKGQVRGSFGDELRKAGNALSNYLDGQKEVPSGPPERANIRKVFARTLDELRDEYPALTMSDLQALLWYPEKRLYDSAKSAEEGATSYEDDEAPDYANAAAKLARGKGVSEDDIARTIKEVDDELQAADGAGSAGRADRGSAQSQGAVAALAQEGATGRATLDDFSPERIGDILQRDDWSILTAENPMGQKLSDEENSALMEQLKADLDALGYQYLPAIGKYGNVENSLVIVGIPEEDAVALGAKYNQDSVLTRRGLIYPRDNSVTPVTGKVTVFDQAPEDFYTEIPGTGAKFAIDLNWGEQTTDEGVLNQPAYHGSPYRGIDRFSTQHIGKGEGAQAYGWGLYFAARKKIAEFYRASLAEPTVMLGDTNLSTLAQGTGEEVAAARRLLGDFKNPAVLQATDDATQQKFWRDTEQFYRNTDTPEMRAVAALFDKYGSISSVKPGGQLYTVEVPDDSDLLDYDAPVNEQPEKVRKALEEMGFQPSYYVVVNENMTTVAGGREFATLADAQRYIRQNNISGMPLERKNRVTGRDVYRALEIRLGSDEAASKALAAVGIPGLRYLDANSRGARADTKSHNYVIFHDDAVQKTGELYQGQQDMFASDLATKRSTVPTRRVISSSGETAKGGNVNSAGQQITATKQGLQNFWSWFGNSETVDEKGRPVVYYHTTKNSFDSFEPNRVTKNSGTFGEWETQRAAMFFTDSLEDSQAYGKIDDKFVAGANVMPVYLRAEDVLDLTGGYLPSNGADESRIAEAGLSPRYFYNFDWSKFDDEGGQEMVAGLKRAGYDAVKFWDQNPDTQESFVALAVFDPGQIKSALGNRGTFDPANPSILEQGPRGTFNPSTLTTSLLESADLSTFLHETGHFFLTVMADIASQPNAPAAINDDMGVLLKWFGVKDLETWNSMSLEQQRKHHERFAESFEQYLLEGKAPSTELQQLFHRFRAWLTNVYRSLREFMVGRNLDLNDEVRAVFDRLLASESQIKQAEMLRGYEPLFKSAAEAGMTPQEWAAYQAQGQEATDQAIDQQQSRSLRDMRWATNARNKMLKALQKDAAGKRKAVEAEVAAEVAKEPIYQAMRWLRKGEMTSEDGEEIKAEKGFRLSTDALAEMYPDGALDNPDLERLKGMTAANGLHPDVVAGMFGFSSGDQLVRALADAEPMSSVVEGLTDSRMLERFGDLATEQGIQRAADEAIHNEARGRFVATELATLQAAMGGRQETGRTDKKGRPITSNVMVKAAKQFAENIVMRRKVRDLKVGPHTAAETRAAKNAEKALRKGDTQAAIVAKRDQLLNHYAARATTDTLDEVDRALTYLKKFERDAVRKKLDASYLDQIDKLLERVELRERTLRALDKRAKLADWIKSQEDLGIEPEIPDYVREDAQLTNYKELTVEEFRGLVDTVKQIEHLARLKNKLLTAKDQREFEAIRDSIAQSILDNAGKRSANTRTPTTLTGKALAAVKAFGAAHIKAATLARVMDGNKDGGPVWEYFVRSANERGDQETAMRAEATKALAEIVEPWLKAGKPNQKKFFATINRSLTRQEALVIALNTGNEGNLQRLLGGEGWTADQLKPVLESLSAQDWQVVQSIWNHFESYRPLIAEKEKRVFGKEPDWIEPTPFEVTTADGKQIQVKGGYYPIKYDPAASVRAEEHADAEGAKRLLKGAYGVATTRRSFTKTRAEEVNGRPLLYDLSGVYSGVNDVVHDLAWHEWLIDVNRLLKSTAIDSAMRNTYGPDAVRQFKTWRDAIAEGDQASGEAIDIALGRLRQSVSIAGLGFNVMSALMQPLGFTQSISRIGAAHVGRGMLEYIGHPIEATREVNEKSTFMRNRSRTRFRELNEIRNRVQGQSAFQRAMSQHAYTLMLRVQQMVDVPTWLGAYEKALASGNDEKRAIALADQAVIDSQGGGQTKDLAAIERGGQAAKLFTVFYSFMNTTANLLVASKMGPDSKAKFAANLLLLTVVPALLGSILKDALTPGDSGDDDREKLAKKLAGEQLSYLLGLVVVGREFGEATKTAFGLADRPRDYAGPAGLRAIADAYKFAKQAGQGEFDDSFRKAAVNLAGDLMGLPAAQINRTITGTKALLEGETQNPAAIVMGYQKP